MGIRIETTVWHLNQPSLPRSLNPFSPLARDVLDLPVPPFFDPFVDRFGGHWIRRQPGPVRKDIWLEAKRFQKYGSTS